MVKNWIKYWRNSLADGERMEQNLQKLEHFKLEQLDMGEGILPPKQVNDLIDKYEFKLNREKGIENKDDEDWIEINQVSIIVSPFAVLPKYEHAKKVVEKDKVYPFWLNAGVNRLGKLIIPEVKYPVFIRRVLEPAIQEDQLLLLSSVDRVDKAMSEGIPDIDSWSDYWNFISSIFKKVTDQGLYELSLEELSVKNEAVIAIDDKLDGAGDGIIKLYDQLSREDTLPALLTNASNTAGQNIKALIQESKWPLLINEHLGQMSDKFPLSFTQRQSLIHYSTLQSGDTLAVNGPPGTGKTTLLQSVVAHEYVKAALHGNDPFVMVASSTNNQAVTNIIESFSKADSTHELLAERWLPDISSYALYLPSSSVEPKEGVHYSRTNGMGLPSSIETQEFLEKARAHFLSKNESHFGKPFNDVSSATEHLHQKLKQIDNRLKDIQQGWRRYLDIEKLLRSYFEPNTLTLFKDNNLDRQAIDAEVVELSRLLEGYYRIKESESFWLVLFSFIKFFKEKRAIPYKRLFQTSNLEFPEIDFYMVNQIEELLLTKINLLKKVIVLDDQWSKLKSANGITSNPPALFNELDQGLRHEAFLLATHYWEGRWILEVDTAIAEDILRKVGEPNMRRRFQRYAMLCPCFVSTFYMLPKFFIYKKYGDGTYPEFPMLEFIDLLIVDEAGQVTPEVGVASFALAKKALVVGDIKQIDPIWKIPKPVDHANLLKFEALRDNSTSEEFDTKGFTASAGSIMRLAQNASYYHAAKQEAKGMMLVEHRRCFNEIIAYCNDLAYHGLLKPLRGTLASQSGTHPLPALGLSNVEGESKRENGSRSNEKEAVAIANWLVENRQTIERFYTDPKDPKKKFEEHIGIITPFAAQKHVLKRMLKKAGFDTRKLTVGTVHALQGAERAIIIFSSVYASNESGRSFFFDRGVNMLNVAVSRAKDSFMLFGDTKVLNPKAQSPSGMLIRHLRNKGVEV
ncbi:AAA domain-containing protein [Reichenbachiella sp.]